MYKSTSERWQMLRWLWKIVVEKPTLVDINVAMGDNVKKMTLHSLGFCATPTQRSLSIALLLAILTLSICISKYKIVV